MAPWLVGGTDRPNVGGWHQVRPVSMGGVLVGGTECPGCWWVAPITRIRPKQLRRRWGARIGRMLVGGTMCARCRWVGCWWVARNAPGVGGWHGMWGCRGVALAGCVGEGLG